MTAMGRHGLSDGLLLRPVRISAALAMLALITSLVLASACSPMASAWRATSAVQSAGNLTADTIVRLANARHDQCIAKHGKGTEAYSDCISDWRQVVTYWLAYAKPTINSALAATVQALLIAEKAKADKRPPWTDYLKPAVCAIAKVLTQWSHLFGDAKAQIEGFLSVAQGVACE